MAIKLSLKYSSSLSLFCLRPQHAIVIGDLARCRVFIPVKHTGGGGLKSRDSRLRAHRWWVGKGGRKRHLKTLVFGYIFT